MKNTQKVTISDIAAAAGVSKTTVSRYINGRMELMSEKTQQRIAAVIEMSGYRPSDIARSLKSQKTRLIGVLIADISSPFSAAVVLGVSECLDRRGYTPLFVNCGDSPAQESRFLDSLLARGVDGFLVNPTTDDNVGLIRLACQGVPIVLCDRAVKNYQFDIVTGDYARAMFSAVQHLQAQGYTRPAFFTPRWEHNSVRTARRQGFLDAVRALYGRDAAGDVYLLGTHAAPAAGEALAAFLAAVGPDERPAVIGVNSVTTVQVLNAVKARGLSMPAQIGLCGPEDWDWDPEMNWPQLAEPNVTTMMVHARGIGARAAECLLRRIGDPSLPPQQILLPSELIVRASTLLRGAPAR